MLVTLLAESKNLKAGLSETPTCIDRKCSIKKKHSIFKRRAYLKYHCFHSVILLWPVLGCDYVLHVYMLMSGLTHSSTPCKTHLNMYIENGPYKMINTIQSLWALCVVKGAGWLTDLTLRKERTSIKTPSTASPSPASREPSMPPYLML